MVELLIEENGFAGFVGDSPAGVPFNAPSSAKGFAAGVEKPKLNVELPLAVTDGVVAGVFVLNENGVSGSDDRGEFAPNVENRVFGCLILNSAKRSKERLR